MDQPQDPVFIGHVATTKDALLLFEACLSGKLQPLTRRPLDRERPSLIKSGNIFIYEERASGIKRWTDGLVWSPSRVLSNFLVYRELDEHSSFNFKEKKSAKKSKKSKLSLARNMKSSGSFSEDMQRSLVGSLVDSYEFKKQGLVKKTISITIEGVSHHLVSYYSLADAMSQQLATPSMDPRLRDLPIRPELLGQEFSISLQEEEALPTLQTPYPFPQSNYSPAQNTYSPGQTAYSTTQSTYNYQPTQQSYSNHPNHMSPLPAPWNTSTSYQAPSQIAYSPKPSLPPPYPSSPWTTTASYNEPSMTATYSLPPSSISTYSYSGSFHNPYGAASASSTFSPLSSPGYSAPDYRQQQQYHQQTPYSPMSESGSGRSYPNSSSPESQLSPSSTDSFPSQPAPFDPSGFQYFQPGP